MPPVTEGTYRKQVELKLPAEEFEIRGFFAKYNAYSNDQGGEGESFGWFLTLIGAIALIVGVTTLIFGPETIYYDRFAGPNLLQLIQMWPGPITTVGGVCLAFGSKLRFKFVMSPEDYLRENYQLVGADGQALGGQIDVRHIRSDTFQVVSNQPEAPSAPEPQRPKELS